MHKTLLTIFALLVSTLMFSKESEYTIEQNIAYRPEASSKCLLDVAYVPGRTNRPVIVWFHGGGLTKGRRYCPKGLMKEDYIVVGVEYRMYPEIKVKEILRDCAASVAWVYKNIARYGGSDSLVFIAGHSAGAYICGMLGLDKSYLEETGIDADSLAGIGMYSAQVITHFTERKDRGIKIGQPIIDEMAPLYHIRKDSAPIFITTGDRDLEMVCRYEENAYFYKMLKYVGHQDVVIYEEQGYSHSKMNVPSDPIFLEWIKKHTK